jgi:single-stranded-DNA-specific exonuclease
VRVRSAEPAPALVSTVGSEVVARVLAARGIQAPDALDRSLSRLLPPDSLEGVEAAAELLARHIDAGSHICVVGDYDADGATSTALAISGLRALGATNTSFLVPDRVRDGYGLGTTLAERAAATGAQLLVTVDNGIASIEGVALARAAGVDVLVTDHHLPPPTLPDANVIVNPNLDGSRFGSRALCGVGVMFYVLLGLRALLRARGRLEGAGPNLADWLDLVALGTVADVVPLDANNRVLVQQGLLRIRAGRARPGVQALLKVARRDVARLGETDLAFAIAPRLNAAGRLADMGVGVRCLLAETQAEADALATTLNAINVERRALSERMTAEALLLVEEALRDDAAAAAELGDAARRTRCAVCLHDAQWHEGVIGIVAGRVRESTGLPSFAFANAVDGSTGQPVLKGSGRSIDGVNLRDVLVEIDRSHPGLLLRFGGHAMAAGVTITLPRLRPFRAALEATIARLLGDARPEHAVDSDGSLPAHALLLDTALALEAAGPWGSGFPPARFHDVFDVVHVRRLAPGFTKLVVRRDERMFEALCNGATPAIGERCTLLYGLGVNRFRDAVTLQLQVDRWWPVDDPGDREVSAGDGDARRGGSSW